MEQSLSDALSIMAVGMITVFFILWLVILIGNILIRLTNKFWPELEIAKNENINSDSTTAVIIAAVDVVLNGKGKVTKITKNS